MVKGNKTSHTHELDTMMGDVDWTSAIIAVVLMAIGLWFIAGGFSIQFNVTRQNFDWMVAAWYAIGVALVWYGKMWGWKASCCGACHT
jgi:ethanolamine transporter EutH